MARNKAPTITSSPTNSVSENQLFAIDVDATDKNRGDTLTYSISGGADAGLFTIDTATGELIFKASPDFEVPGDANGDNIYAVQVTVSDGSLTDSQDITITVTNDPSDDGPDNPASISGDTLGAVTEDNPATASGTLTVIDSDPGESAAQVDTGNTTYGSYTVDAAGAWEYTLDNADPAVQALGAGDSATDTFVVTSLDDSASETVTITISGVNDVASFSGQTAGAVTEDNPAVAAGALTVSDLDADESAAQANAGGTTYGGYTVDAAGNWEYTLDSGDAAVQALDTGETLTDTFIVTSLDGSASETVTVAINGTDESGGNTAPNITSGATSSVSENQTFAIDVDATDDAGGLAYAISGGADANAFNINTTTGEITFKTAPNFEAPGDAGGNNVYNIDVIVTDAGGLTDTQAIAITVADVSEGGGNEIYGAAALSDTLVGTADADTISGLEEGSTQSGQGTIDTLTGGAGNDLFILGTSDTRYYDDGNDRSKNNGKNDYALITDFGEGVDQIQINGATDSYIFQTHTLNGVTGLGIFYESSRGSDGFDSRDELIGLIDGVVLSDINFGPTQDGVTVLTYAGVVNAAPSITSAATASVSENQSFAIDVDADDDAGGLVFSIAGGSDSADFDIDAATGELTFKVPPDFEAPDDANADNIYHVDVAVADAGGLTDTQAIAITVTDVDENAAPSITSAATASVSENQSVAIDVDADDDAGGLVFSIAGGSDSANFDIDAATGELTFKVPPDFEAPDDADADNIYHVDVAVADAGGLTDTQAIAITVTDVDENAAPSITSAATASVSENQSFAIDVDADDDAGGLVFSIAGGSDSANFDIDAATGELTFKVPPDFEAPDDANADNIYHVDVAVADAGGLTDTQAIAITVTDVDENAAPSITSAATASVSENQSVAIDVDADDDAGGLVFSIAGGSDSANFDIDAATGELTFKVPPDFEAPDDADADNIYHVDVAVADAGGLTDTQAIAITVTDVDENAAPSITSAATASVSENQSFAIDVDADDDAGGLVFSIAGGSDSADFDIDAATGELTFKVPPDFEAPDDANADNIYHVDVAVADAGGLTDTQAIAITVTDVDENAAPSITSAATASVSENQTFAIDVDADDDAGGLVFSIAGGSDSANFDIDAATGELTFKVPPDFEAPDDADADNIYHVDVAVADAGGLTDTQAIAITVTDVDENAAPSITSAATASVSENQSFAIDVDADDDAGGLVFSIAGGSDSADFDIDAATGELTFKVPPDFEAPDDANADNIYHVDVAVADAGGLTDTQAIAITVTDVDENAAPSITSAATASVSENQSFAIDVDADDDAGGLVFSIAGGSDSADFDIDAATGELTFKVPPDFEAPDDANADNIYHVDVAVADAGGLTDTQAIAITVTDVDENAAPSITSAATASVSENQTFAIDVDADDDAGGLVFSIAGGSDSADFDIDAATGELTFKVPPDFEAPDDANADNIYHVDVAVADAGGLTDTQAIAITVTDVDENAAPSITSAATASVSENQSVAIDVDADDDAGGLVFSIAGGSDSADFDIDAATGELTFKVPPDFEAPDDANADNIYHVDVAVADAGGLTDTQAIAITVADVDETVSPPPASYSPTDTLYADGSQWHFDWLSRFPGAMEQLWAEYTGDGVSVAVYDNGVDYTHADLDDNYDSSTTVSVGGVILDPLNPQPISGATYFDHATAVAGLIAAENDGTGTVGVAFDAELTGVNIFDNRILGSATDLLGLLDVLNQQDQFDIVNHSWGETPAYGPDSLQNPGPPLIEVMTGVLDAVENGRGGLGTLIFKAVGNDGAGAQGDSLNWTRHTFSIGAMDEDGDVASYSNRGANLLVVAPSSTTLATGNIVTTDIEGSAGYSGGDYTTGFGGTSAATPIAAGVAALILEANPDLGWRDVREILAYSARHVGSDIGGPPQGDEMFGWDYNAATNWNGGGLHFSADYGFGLIDPHAAVRMAEVWSFFDEPQTSANEDILEGKFFAGAPLLQVPPGSVYTSTYTPTDLDGNGIDFDVDMRIEYVEFYLEIDYTAQGFFPADMTMTLTSPSGTSAIVFSPALTAYESALTDGYISWTFGFNAFQGETLYGPDPLNNKWSFEYFVGTFAQTHYIDAFQLNFYGEFIDGHGAPVVAPTDDVYHYTDEVFAALLDEPGRMTLSDDGGSDWLNMAAMTGDLNIDLAAGATSTSDGVAFLTIAAGISIENAVTGDGDDTVTGNALGNLLVGMRGDDTLLGLDGNDVLAGMEGSNILTGGSGLDTFYFEEWFGIDTVTDFEQGVDTVNVSSFDEIYDFADFWDNSYEDGAGNVIYDLNNDSVNRIVFENEDKDDFDVADFEFGYAVIG